MCAGMILFRWSVIHVAAARNKTNDVNICSSIAAATELATLIRHFVHVCMLSNPVLNLDGGKIKPFVLAFVSVVTGIVALAMLEMSVDSVVFAIART